MIQAYEENDHKVDSAIFDGDNTVGGEMPSFEDRKFTLNHTRNILLHSDTSSKMIFAPAQTRKEREALNYIQSLSPQERTKKLGEYAQWFDDQQRELNRVIG